jgi:Family of unknown function (DUF6529)
LEDLIEALTQGNVVGTKVVLTSVVSALAIYQVFLMAVGYGRVRLPFLGSRPASATHRAVGDSVVVLTLLVALMCLSYFGFDEGGDYGSENEGVSTLHMYSGALLVAVLALKIIVVRWWHQMSRFLPTLGIMVFLLFAVTWLSSAGDFLLGWW